MKTFVVDDVIISMVNLRGTSAKHFWDELEQFGAQLEDLGVGDVEVENV